MNLILIIKIDLINIKKNSFKGEARGIRRRGRERKQGERVWDEKSNRLIA